MSRALGAEDMKRIMGLSPVSVPQTFYHTFLVEEKEDE